ncbi:FadR/GntR family transcriptional regulator [Arthrobacter cupressi]
MKLSDQIVDHMQRAIVRGDYAADSRLPTEAELCESLGVSRSVVRDALRTLSSMGLIAVRQGHGIFVTSPDDDQLVRALALRLHRSDLKIGEVMEARRVIEGAIAAEVAHVGTPDDLARIRGFFEQFRTAVKNSQWKDAHLAHSNFHLAILKALRLPALELVLPPLQELILGSSLPPETEEIDMWDVDAHEPIVTALESGDAHLARAAMRAHFDYIDKPEYAEYKTLLFRDAATLPSFSPPPG